MGGQKVPLQMPRLLHFLRQRSGTRPWGIFDSRSLQCREESIMKLGFFGPNPRCLLSLQVLACSGVHSNTAWQSFKCASHPAQSRSNYRLLCNTVFEVGAAYLKRQHWEGNCLLWMGDFQRRHGVSGMTVRLSSSMTRVGSQMERRFIFLWD